MLTKEYIPATTSSIITPVAPLIFSALFTGYILNISKNLKVQKANNSS